MESYFTSIYHIINNKLLLIYIHKINTTERCFLFATFLDMRELLSVCLHRKDLEILVCPESDCESPRKYLFKDLDGRALGLPSPVSVFPKTEAEWTGSFYNTGWFYLNLMPPVEGGGR